MFSDMETNNVEGFFDEKSGLRCGQIGYKITHSTLCFVIHSVTVWKRIHSMVKLYKD